MRCLLSHYVKILIIFQIRDVEHIIGDIKILALVVATKRRKNSTPTRFAADKPMKIYRPINIKDLDAFCKSYKQPFDGHPP